MLRNTNHQMTHLEAAAHYQDVRKTLTIRRTSPRTSRICLMEIVASVSHNCCTRAETVTSVLAPAHHKSQISDHNPCRPISRSVQNTTNVPKNKMHRNVISYPRCSFSFAWAVSIRGYLSLAQTTIIRSALGAVTHYVAASKCWSQLCTLTLPQSYAHKCRGAHSVFNCVDRVFL